MTYQNQQIDQDQLVAELRAKKPEAMSYLYDNYSGAIYGSIVRIVGDESVAQEVLQDAFMKFWDKIDQYDSSRGRFFTWMVNISRNLSIDRLRSKELKKSGKTDDISDYVTGIGSSDSEIQQTDAIGIKDSMKDLRDEEKYILEMVYFKGYTQSEIAEESGIPIGTVKTRLRMALKNMRIALKIE